MITKLRLIFFFFDHFKNLHSAPEYHNLSSFTSLNVLDEKKLLESNNYLHSELDDPICVGEIAKGIRKLKNNKVPGLDRFRNVMLKTTLRFIKSSLAKRFTFTLKSEAFPTLWGDQWNHYRITALHKSRSKDDPSNYSIKRYLYRQLSWQTFLFDPRLANNRFLNFSINVNYTHRSQIGFLPGNRTLVYF